MISHQFFAEHVAAIWNKYCTYIYWLNEPASTDRAVCFSAKRRRAFWFFFKVKNLIAGTRTCNPKLWNLRKTVLRDMIIISTLGLIQRHIYAALFHFFPLLIFSTWHVIVFVLLYKVAVNRDVLNEQKFMRNIYKPFHASCNL